MPMLLALSRDPGGAIPPVALREDIACDPSNADGFFPDAGGEFQARAAVRVCERCPAIEACAEWAISTRQQWGVWGGLTRNERAKIIEQREADAA